MSKDLMSRPPNADLPAEREVPKNPAPWLNAFPWLSLEVSHAEIRMDGHYARVSGARSRLEDGRLTTERFDGVVDPEVFEEAVHRLQEQMFAWSRLVQDQMRLFMPWL